MLRLGLNIASTRLILAHGHEGTHGAGAIIEAFGTFLMGGNIGIGLTVFAILIVINFVVITKGAGCVAEDAARFRLDALHGKQLAVEACLSAVLTAAAAARGTPSGLAAQSEYLGGMQTTRSG